MFPAFLLTLASITFAFAGEWTIPVAGNAFRSEPSPGPVVNRQGHLTWSNPNECYSLYFHADRAASIELAVLGATPSGKAKWKIEIDEKTYDVVVTDKTFKEIPVGKLKLKTAGYVEVRISEVKTTSTNFGQLQGLVVRSKSPELALHFVKSNQNNMFYWGRRGASVHLGYQMPRLPAGTQAEWAYSEIKVPQDQDPIGSYFMANGFAHGYFGIQVKSPNERWVLFSVWSPFHTNNPQEIPEADRIITEAKGRGVRAQNFGGEGSGGQSFLVYPWRTDTTYRFLTRIRPNNDQTTTYTAWFGNKAADEWRLIASFRRPRTQTHLTGFHSFLENFAPDFGAKDRMAQFSNQWVCDTAGVWHEVTRARFTADETARSKNRLDYAGGVTKRGFFLKNGGFFDDRVAFDQNFKRDSNHAGKPEIDFSKLPMK